MRIPLIEKGALQPVIQRLVPAKRCYLAYFSAILAGMLTLRYAGVLVVNAIWIGCAITCVSTVVIWIFSIASGNSSIYDPYWVVAPPLLALAIKAAGGDGLLGTWHLRQIVVLACLIIWAFRYHIFYSWSGWRTGLAHEDWRYEAMRGAPVPYWLNSLLGMHLFPTILVYLAFVPAALVLSARPASLPMYGMWDVVGVVLALAAIAIEFFADRQLRAYRGTEDYRGGGVLREGLWKYSRHPNYFGEVLFWVSMIPFAIGGGMIARFPFLVLAGPAAMAVFFRFSSFLMDLRSLAKRPDYRRVIEETSSLVPWMLKSGKQR